MKGQLESSFQWIFVLIAGGMFLIFFFMLLRGCVRAEESRTTGLAVDTVATRLESLTWQPELKRRIAATGSVQCPAGTLTLIEREASASIDAPAFLSPTLHGTVEIETHEVTLPGSPPLPLGNVLYGLDQDTTYLILQSAPFERGQLVPAEAVLSTTAKTLVLLTDAGQEHIQNAPVATIPDAVDVRGVALENNHAIFFVRENGVMISTGSLPYLHEALMQGALVSGDIRTFACARAQFVNRMRKLTELYERRATLLTSQHLPTQCITLLEEATALLKEANAKEHAAYVAAVFDHHLIAQQNALTYASCPVIA